MGLPSLIALLLSAAAAPPEAPPPRTQVAPLSAELRAKMEGVTWKPGCPVPLDALSALMVPHHGMDGAVHDGLLIVATDQATAVAGVFDQLFDAGFVIEAIRPAHEFGGDDDALMAANITSAFNCRPVAGGKRFSDHSLGLALDLNPRINPYVRGDKVDPPAGRAYLSRDPAVPGLVTADGPAVAAFGAIGWKWGGAWKSAQDYQHFSLTGR